MTFTRTVLEICGDYALLESEAGTQTEVALALLPDGISAFRRKAKGTARNRADCSGAHAAGFERGLRFLRPGLPRC